MKSRVVVVGLINKRDKYLLGRKPKNIGPYPNTWNIPGGGVNLEEETVEEALRREIAEETAIEIDDIQHIGFDEDTEPDKHGEMTHYLFLAFKATYKSGTVKPGDDISSLSWVGKDKIKSLTLNKPSKKLFKNLKIL
ncbi:hypothetical protein A2363_01015 [Candidatus Gottesmanbacteria bacterium RIFOXYB1_FULL_47_11]|uniref:Nudix hydrolase domain-containing protein n=1 Tax=Candidatus Gottesmanbacteria bacterium RIFOXYB1_FULL_47_11 TaxID=1798401 RepID=A0A1F6BGJ9_9BACT|nr:MAG: hypothetical protein A2363_01015 [Candidatus Gottesmanbacteria bacterium RIFOXYB1_FULL_47_11]